MNVACSWSGGKDCCLALSRALDAGHRLGCLVTMMTEDGRRSRSNGVRVELLQAHADALGAELIAVATTWNDYERSFADAALRARRLGAEAMVFGDIRGDAHREWNLQRCADAGLESLMPLWGMSSLQVLAELPVARIEARVTALRADLLSPSWLGRPVDRRLARALGRCGADPCGELGEYHSLAIDAKCFSHSLAVRFQEISERSGYWHRDAVLA